VHRSLACLGLALHTTQLQGKRQIAGLGSQWVPGRFGKEANHSHSKAERRSDRKRRSLAVILFISICKEAGPGRLEVLVVRMVMDFGVVFCRFEVGDHLRVLRQLAGNLFLIRVASA